MANDAQLNALDVTGEARERELAEMITSKRVFALKNLQLERIKAEVELHKKIFALELEYQGKFEVFDNKRALIVKGEYEPTTEECNYPHRDPNMAFTDPPTKGIPHFWSTIMRNLEMFNDMVQLRDEPALDKLVDVRCTLLSNPNGFKLEFEFDENEFFSNKVLTKEYYFAESYDPKVPLEYDGPYVSYAKGCIIDWKSSDKNLTVQKVTKKLKNKQSNQTKTVEKEEACDSFFNFFSPPTERIENFEADGDAEITVEQEDMRQLLLADFDIGETFRHNVVPRAVIYYTGEGIEDDDEFDEECHYSEDDFDEVSDEDEDDDEIGGDGPADKHGKHGGGVHKKKGSPHKGSKGHKGSKNQDPPVPSECKQQ